jgi:hypothetical protein
MMTYLGHGISFARRTSSDQFKFGGGGGALSVSFGENKGNAPTLPTLTVTQLNIKVGNI